MPTPHAEMTYESFAKAAPEANAALLALGKGAVDAGLSKDLLELVKLRASQINGCAFCAQLHLNVARGLGVPAEKLDLCAMWREAGVHTPREKAALAWTEALTGMSGREPDEAAWAAAVAEFGDGQAVWLTVAIGTINAWNRIAGGLRFAPPVLRRKEQAA